jgi:4-hydroxy-2-oxoheptanedioate aldolase
MLANAGFDWLCVDLQHGLLDYQDLLHMLPAISTTATTPIVRVSGNDPREIMKVLDAGAMGVIVPLVNNRAEAAAAIAACRYPPQGGRSFGPIRAALYGGRGYAAEANDQIACIAMIETKEGIDNLEEIVTTPGLGGVYIGRSDLAYALGLPPNGDTEEPLHLETVDRILRACKRHGVPAGIHTSSLEWTQRRLAAGFEFVTLGSDAGFMMQAAARDLAAARGTQQQARERTGY